MNKCILLEKYSFRTRVVQIGSRIAVIEKSFKKWEAIFNDDKSTIYEASTLKKLLDNLSTIF